MRIRLLTGNNDLHCPGFYEACIKVELSIEISKAMKTVNISCSELANRVGVNPSCITRMLRANDNFTVGTLAKLSMALDYEWHISLKPRTQ